MDKSNPLGQTFNNLTVLAFSHSDPLQHRIWKCRCICGTEVSVATRNLGKQIGCGCHRKTKRWKTDGDISGSLYSHMVFAAKRRGLELKVTVEYLWELFLRQNKRCAFSGVVLDFGQGKNGRNRTASLDRIDSTKDYVEGNVQWVHRRINVMKQDMTEAEFMALCHLIVNFKGMEMKQTNPGIVDPQSASESLVIPAINYYRRKRLEPRRVSVSKKLESGKIPFLTTEQEQEIVALRQSKHTIRAISEKTGINRARVTWWLQKCGFCTQNIKEATRSIDVV